MKHKSRMRFEIKEISEDGTFEGILSPYSTVDQGGDIVEPGAYTKTLKEQGNSRPMLWQHRTDTPIGELELEDRTDGLWCKGKLLMPLPEAQKAYLLIKAKIVKGLSIGFETIKETMDGNIRRLKEIKLWEGSVVTFPMHLGAMITSVKGKTEIKGDFNEELAEIQLQDGRYQIMSALSCALSQLLWASLTRDQKISAAETIIQQFEDAYMAFLPAYLDMLTEQYGAMETWSQKRLETKAGKKISAATKETLAEAHKCMKSAIDMLSPLLDDEAEPDDDSVEEKKVDPPTPTPAADPQPEPENHSAAQTLVNTIRSLIPAA